MAALDTVSLMILFAALLVLAGILSSLVALRFGAPLLLVFLVIGMLAGESGPGGMKFDDVHTTYLVGSVALALILFDGGLRTRFATFRSVLAPSLVLATIGVLLTAALTAPAAHYMLGFGWVPSFLVGAVVASTDAAAVFLLIHTRGLRLRPRVGATLEIESGTNDPFAIFLTLALVGLLLAADESWWTVLQELAVEAVGGALIGLIGGRALVAALNRLSLPQGLHAPLVTTGALVVFAIAQALHASGFLAVYLAGLIVGNRPTRAHNSDHRLSRRRDLARPDRHVRAARAAGVAGAAVGARGAGPRRRGNADVHCAPARGVSVPRAVPVLLAREDRSSPGSACAGRSASSSLQFRCWSA